MSVSLRGRLTLGLLFGAGLLCAAAGAVLDRVIAARLHREFDETLLARAESLRSLTEDQGGRLWLELTERVMPEFQAARRPEYFELRLRGGPTVARSRSLGSGHLAIAGAPLDRPLLRDVDLPGGRRGRQVELTFHPRAEIEEVGEGAEEAAPGSALVASLAVAKGRDELDALLSGLRLALLLVVAGLLAATALMVKVVVRIGLTPLDALARRLDSLGPDSLGERVSADGEVPSELVPVIGRLDDLLSRLHRSFARERAFSANLAHELRTPLAELRAVADVGLRWPGDGAALVAALTEARATGLQMEQLVATLLQLARFDGRQHAVERSTVMLRELVEACWQGVAAAAGEKGMALQLDVPADLSITTDREKLALVLANLLANAVEHGDAGTPIVCSTSSDHGKVTLRLANAAGALTAEDVPHLFDRFWRKDPARSGSSQGGRHTGLGLALVAALCEVLGIERDVSVVHGTFVLTLRLPPAPPGVGQSETERGETEPLIFHSSQSATLALGRNDQGEPQR